MKKLNLLALSAILFIGSFSNVDAEVFRDNTLNLVNHVIAIRHGNNGIADFSNYVRHTITAVQAAGIAANQNVPVNLQVASFTHQPGVANPVFQMAGIAAFVPQGGGQVAIYRAAKRIGNPAFNGIWNYGNDEHTERQLAIAALEEAAGNMWINGNVVIGGVNTIVRPNNVLPGNNTANLAGDLHIYTYQPPCINPPNGINCLDYYRQLLAACPNINIHVYFDNTQIRLDENEIFILNQDDILVNDIINYLNIGNQIQNYNVNQNNELLDRRTVRATLAQGQVNYSVPWAARVNNRSRRITDLKYLYRQMNHGHAVNTYINLLNNYMNNPRITFHAI